jgi:hypothetical protein
MQNAGPIESSDAENLSPVTTAGCVLNIVRFIERHNIKRNRTQEGAIRTARIGLEIGVGGDHYVPWYNSAACKKVGLQQMRLNTRDQRAPLASYRGSSGPGAE